MPSPSAVILLSGGLDSAVTLALAVHAGTRCHALAVEYGQRHAAELEASRAIAAHLGATWRCVRVDLGVLGGSALTDRSISVPKDRAVHAGDTHALPTDIPPTYVPARNLVMLSVATAYAETLGAREVHIGVNAVDYSGYPDCRDEFISAFERAATLGTKAGMTAQGEAAVHVARPLVHWTKARIIREGLAAGAPLHLTLSCYDPVLGGSALRADSSSFTSVPPPAAHHPPPTSWLHCGRCDSCRIRARGFVEAGVDDPTRYAAAPGSVP